MRELTSVESDQTAGGVALGVVFLVAVGSGIVVAYVHEKSGGIEGVKRGFKRVTDSITGSEREPE